MNLSKSDLRLLLDQAKPKIKTDIEKSISAIFCVSDSGLDNRINCTMAGEVMDVVQMVYQVAMSDARIRALILAVAENLNH